MRRGIIILLFLCSLIVMLSVVSCLQFDGANSNSFDKSVDLENDIKEKLFGMWQYGGRSIGAGYNHIYYFNKDGTYRFQHSQYDGENREIEHSGEWKVNGNKIYLTVKKKIELEGGVLSEASGSVSSEKEIIGGETKEVYLSLPETMEISISDYNSEEGTININGEEYWNLDQKYYEKESMESNSYKLGDMQENGFEVIEEQSFEVELNNFGNVRFVSGCKNNEYDIPKIYFYLVDKQGYVRYTFPEFYGNEWTFSELKAVAFEDINKDGLKDVIVISEYIFGHGANADEPFKVAGVYLQKGSEFVSMDSLNNEINGTKNNNSIKEVTEFLNKQNIKAF
ncbi:hypothetical protein [Acetivibrio cellulolyticus]|uniref:hypothetical protein n=1 Tax=Acetivibrio cellulolyticus TaxID=35830 RepID=UPI0001E2F0F7|nr:hypothetical protein [Acetivibrio cellulolyticus]